jgi:hypothetical protein
MGEAATPLSASDKAKAAALAAEAGKEGTNKLLESQGTLTIATNHLSNTINKTINESSRAQHAPAVHTIFGDMHPPVGSPFYVAPVDNGARPKKN